MEYAMEQRNELERKNGGGGKDCKKEKTQEQRTHTGKARKTHKKPHMKTPHIYKVETGKTGKGRSTHRLTENKRNNYPEGKTGKGRPKTEGKRRTTDKKTARTENGKRSGIHRNKAVLNRHRAHKTGHSRPRKPPTLQHHGCPADKGGFSWAAYGNDDTGRTGQARHGKSEYPYLQDKSP